MPFNSFEFLLIFLPLCYVGFVGVQRLFGWQGAYLYLAAASFVFYAQFSHTLVLVLAASVALNYVAGRLITYLRETDGPAGYVTTAAIAANLFALGYFKYANFFIDVVNQGTGTGFSHLDLLAPVGVSFYTFTQIGFLLEARNGVVGRVGFARYCVFATFFPCVTAGPLLQQRDFFGQTENRSGSAFSTNALAIGLTMFGIGLFKKVVLADGIAPYADTVFDGVAIGAGVDAVNAWTGSLAYTLQLYFDFSGYSDMAVGLGFMFGIRLPLNFNSPFKRSSISEFWRCWHMTMTRFFTTYLYTPMAMKNTRAAMKGGYGPVRRWLSASSVPLFYTFLMAGIWHGAGWTFVVYGLIHGTALAVDHGWRHFKMPSVGPQVGWLMTMAVVVSGLVVFRAPDLATAGSILGGMWGMGDVPDPLDAVSVDLTAALPLILLYGMIVLGAPNSQEIMRHGWVSSDPAPAETDADRHSPLRWRPNTAWALLAAVVLVTAAASIGGASGFLYYKF